MLSEEGFTLSKPSGTGREMQESSMFAVGKVERLLLFTGCGI